MNTDQHSQNQSADPNDPNDRVIGGILAVVVEYENEIRRRLSIRATRAKARTGHAVRRPPTGLVANRAGQWSMDPDPRVRECISRLFEDFERLGSIGKVLGYYHKKGILLPVRNTDLVYWTRPSRGRIRAILTHPAFRGDYIFGRRVTVRGRTCRRANADEIIVVPGHHEPYVTPGRWARIQALLRRHGRSRN
jgi:hypothetical protein